MKIVIGVPCFQINKIILKKSMPMRILNTRNENRNPGAICTCSPPRTKDDA